MTRLFAAVPMARLRRFRVAVLVLVLLDVLLLTPFPIGHGDVPASLYHQHLPVRDLLFLPEPGPVYVQVLRAVIVVAALVGLTGRLPRLTGAVVAVGMLDWLSNAYSYSKINHDHFALMVALAVLPLVLGRRGSPRAQQESAGWALATVQVAVVATYFLAAVSKVLDAGWGWPSSAVLIWALTRRGTVAGDLLLQVPWLTYVFQWISFTAELLAPLMLVLRSRPLYAYVAFWAVFHASTYLLLSIHFLPTAVCLLAFLPLERLSVPARLRRRRVTAPA